MTPKIKTKKFSLPLWVEVELILTDLEKREVVIENTKKVNKEVNNGEFRKF